MDKELLYRINEVLIEKIALQAKEFDKTWARIYRVSNDPLLIDLDDLELLRTQMMELTHTENIWVDLNKLIPTYIDDIDNRDETF